MASRISGFLTALLLAACGQVDAAPPAADVAIVVETEVEVPMRDGVVLRADVQRPAGDGPFPVLLYRTPYGKHRAAEITVHLSDEHPSSLTLPVLGRGGR